MAASYTLPERLPLAPEVWHQLPETIQTRIGQLWEVIPAQEKRMAALEAHVQQHAGNSDRPPSSDSPYSNPRTSSPPKGHRERAAAIRGIAQC